MQHDESRVEFFDFECPFKYGGVFVCLLFQSKEKLDLKGDQAGYLYLVYVIMSILSQYLNPAPLRLHDNILSPTTLEMYKFCLLACFHVMF